MLWSWDLETEDWSHYVLSCAAAADGRRLLFRTTDEVRDWYRSTTSDDMIISFNGGGFDFLLLISIVGDADWTVRMAGSSVVSCRVAGHAECRDAMRLFPGSLADWTGRKQSIGLECRCGKACGGYCRIRRDMPPADFDVTSGYCMNDCEILLETWQDDIERSAAEGWDIIDERTGKPRLTCGSVAWRTMARMAGDEMEPVSWSEYDTGRRCYYGGRCEVGRVGGGIEDGARVAWPRPVHRYDVHQMYPWALTLPVPHGARVSLRGGAAARAFVAGRPGCYRARVVVPDTPLPHLPHRYREKRGRGRLRPGRLLWTTGPVEGYWTGIELANAEAYGARIEAIVSARVYEQESPLYAPFMRWVFRIRDGAKKAKDDRWAGVTKWRANSPTGKLAQRVDTRSVRVLPRGADPIDLMRAGWSRIAGRVWCSPPIRRVPACARPMHAATLTSRARVKLFERLYRNIDRFVYCDTDSTYLECIDEDGVHPSALGAFGYEGPGDEWRAVAPKLYRFMCRGCKQHPNGGQHVRAKGISGATWEMFDALLRGETIYHERGVEKLKTGGGQFTKRVIKRSNKTPGDIAGTRIVLKDGRTRPLRRKRDGTYE